MSSPLVTVFPNPFVSGWPQYADDARCTREDHHTVHTFAQCSTGIVGRLSLALTQAFDCDAHFVAYASSNNRRLTMDALDRGVPITMNYAVFDFDGPGHGNGGGTTVEWREQWRSQ